MELLVSMFPSTFEVFLIAETDGTRTSAPFDYTSIQCCAAFANTFRAIDAQHLLPITLLRLCRVSREGIACSTLSPSSTRGGLIGRSRLDHTQRPVNASSLNTPLYGLLRRPNPSRIPLIERPPSLNAASGAFVLPVAPPRSSRDCVILAP